MFGWTPELATSWDAVGHPLAANAAAVATSATSATARGTANLPLRAFAARCPILLIYYLLLNLGGWIASPGAPGQPPGTAVRSKAAGNPTGLPPHVL